MFDRIGKNNPTLVSTSSSGGSSSNGHDDYSPKAKETNSSSRAGPTPFHRRESYFPHDPQTPKFKWLIYDNEGSFNGWFDWLPLWMRVGYWNPLVVVSLVGFYSAIFWLKPQLEFETIALKNMNEEDAWLLGMPKATVLDLAIFLWGFVVMVHAKIQLGSIGAFPISFTGWSWLLLTFRAGFEFLAWTIATHYSKYAKLASKLATIGSSIRLVTITNACVVCTIWNFILFPIICFKSMPPGEKRTNFLRFNFSFFMTNIHVMNFPLAFMNILSGDRVRSFTISDLWVAYFVVVLYSMLYYFVMDRVGLHFYPIFNPRTAWSGVSIFGVLGLYYFLFAKWNDYVGETI